jgi:hypothetical protein
MITDKTAAELQNLAELGASLEIDGYRFNVDEIKRIALALKPESYLKISNSHSKRIDELQDILLSTSGQVIFA